MDRKENFNKNDLDKMASDELKNIPESVLQMFLQQAMKDAQDIFDNGTITGDFKQVVYNIYRAYILGILFEKKNINISIQKGFRTEIVQKEDNVIYYKF